MMSASQQAKRQGLAIMLEQPMPLEDAAGGRPMRDLRAAWLYYVEGLTQSDVAKKLGVNRIMITRLLSDARARGEVTIRIKSDIAPLIALQRDVEQAFGLDRAIVAPFSDEDGDPTRTIASAAGAYISELMTHNLTVGVGWGRTLHTTLPFVESRALNDVWAASPRRGVSTRPNSPGSSPNSSTPRAFSSPPPPSSTRQRPSTLFSNIAVWSRS